MDHFPIRLHTVIPSGLPFSFYHTQLVLFTALLWFIAVPLLLAVRPAIKKQP
jgi:hypothetical protein